MSRKRAIDEIMLVATFAGRQEQRDALQAAYDAGFYDAEHGDYSDNEEEEDE